MQNAAIFPMFYLPPISYFTLLRRQDKNIRVEDSEHFQKQTYRNRASIYSANGKLDLIVPVQKGEKVHTRIRDVRICNDFRWQRLHWLSLETCYRSTPYFEYYEDYFRPFYEKPATFLFDFNEGLLQVICKLLKMPLAYDYTGEFVREYLAEADYRDSIHPKKDPLVAIPSYPQVFQERHGYLPNLSIIDLLFNRGPESPAYLK